MASVRLTTPGFSRAKSVLRRRTPRRVLFRLGIKEVKAPTVPFTRR